MAAAAEAKTKADTATRMVAVAMAARAEVKHQAVAALQQAQKQAEAAMATANMAMALKITTAEAAAKAHMELCESRAHLAERGEQKAHAKAAQGTALAALQICAEERAGCLRKRSLAAAALTKLEVVTAKEQVVGTRVTDLGVDADVLAMEAGATREALAHAKKVETASHDKTTAAITAVADAQSKALKLAVHVAACKINKELAEDATSAATAHLEALTEMMTLGGEVFAASRSEHAQHVRVRRGLGAAREKKAKAVEALITAEADETLAGLWLDLMQAAKAVAEAAEADAQSRSEARQGTVAAVLAAAAEAEAAHVRAGSRARAEVSATTRGSHARYEFQVAQAAALAAQQKGKDLDAEMKQKASAATTAALVAEAATRAENEAHAAQVEAAKAVAEAENAEELAAADSARKAGMGMARTQAAAAVPKERTVERAVMEEEAAVARTEAAVAEALARARMEARSAAVAAAAAAATAYVEAQALSAAKHRAAARAKMEELTALSDAKLVADGGKRSAAMAVERAGAVLAVESAASLDVHTAFQLADAQALADTTRAALDSAVSDVTNTELALQTYEARLKACDDAKKEARGREAAVTAAASRATETRAAAAAVESKMSLDSKLSAGSLMRAARSLSLLGRKPSEKVLEAAMLSMFEARDAATVLENAAHTTGKLVPAEVDAKIEEAANKVTVAVREAARLAAKNLVSSTSAELKSKRAKLTSLEAQNRAAMQALLDAMHPRSRESLEHERQRQQALDAGEAGSAAEFATGIAGGADATTYIGKMRAHMASHVALAKQNRERANQKKADTDAKVAAVAHAEVRAAEAKAKAIAQAEEEAALLKAEASTGAELEVKKAQAAKAFEELAMITALLERKEREAKTAERAEMMTSSLPLPAKKKERIVEEHAYARQVLEAAATKYAELAKEKETAEMQLQRAEQLYNNAKRMAEHNNGKEAAMEEELKSVMELKAAQEAMGAAVRAHLDAEEVAANYERQTTIRGAEAAIRSEAESEARQLRAMADAAMAAHLEAQKVAKQAAANTKREEEAAILAVKQEAKLKAGIV